MELPEFIPYTRGKGYTHIDAAQFFEAMEHKEPTLSLQKEDNVTLYRVVKEMGTDKIMFFKLNVTILDINEEQMLFVYLFNDAAAFKTMYLDNYGENWCYLREQ